MELQMGVIFQNSNELSRAMGEKEWETMVRSI